MNIPALFRDHILIIYSGKSWNQGGIAESDPPLNCNDFLYFPVSKGCSGKNIIWAKFLSSLELCIPYPTPQSFLYTSMIHIPPLSSSVVFTLTTYHLNNHKSFSLLCVSSKMYTGNKFPNVSNIWPLPVIFFSYEQSFWWLTSDHLQLQLQPSACDPMNFLFTMYVSTRRKIQPIFIVVYTRLG